MVRKVLWVLSAIGGLGVIVVAVLIALAAYRGSSLDTESRAYADAAVPAIMAEEGPGELLDRAAPELLAHAGPSQLRTLFETIALQFGKFRAYEGSRCNATLNYVAGSGSSTSAVCSAKAKFESGEAAINLTLVKRDGHWMIAGFFVNGAPTGTPSKAL